MKNNKDNSEYQEKHDIDSISSNADDSEIASCNIEDVDSINDAIETVENEINNIDTVYTEIDEVDTVESESIDDDTVDTEIDEVDTTEAESIDAEGNEMDDVVISERELLLEESLENEESDNSLVKKSIKRKLFWMIFAILIFVAITISIDSYSDMLEAERQRIAEYNQHLTEIIYSKDLELRALHYSIKELPDVTYYTREQIASMDMSKPSGFTSEELATVLRSGLAGLENSFIAAEQFGVNGVMLASIAVIESGWGTINFYENNMFGYGQSAYPSKDANIMTVAEGVGGNYLNPSGPFYYGTTISHINIKYATSTTWDDKVISQTNAFYSSLMANREVNQQQIISSTNSQISRVNLEKNKTIGHLIAFMHEE